MTFLLFLASIAILEYLLRGVGKPAGSVNHISASHIPANQMSGNPPEPSGETSTTDLLALGRALGTNSRSSTTPDSRTVPKEVSP